MICCHEAHRTPQHDTDLLQIYLLQLRRDGITLVAGGAQCTCRGWYRIGQERWKDLYNFTNPNSSSQVATALWGGQVKVPVDVEVLGEDGEPIRYKSGDKKGQIKTKKGFSMETVQPLVSQDTIDLFNNRGWDKNASAQALMYIQKYDEGDAVEFAQDITGLRHINKTINTYYKPYIDFAVSETIHPTYNHCITQTGRLSSSKPNMQNMNNKEQL